jgi:hypothetical protein
MQAEWNSLTQGVALPLNSDEKGDDDNESLSIILSQEVYMSTRNITDVNLVAYLKCKGYKETARPKLTDQVVTFYFEPSQKLSEEIDAYFSREGVVEPMAMAEALRLLKGQIGDIRRNQKFGGGSDE